MVTLLLDSERLEVVLSPVERAVGFRRGNIQVLREQIAKVMLTDDAWIWLRGVPSPATTVPSVMAIGTWKTGSGRDFAVIRGRRPSVVIDLEGHEHYERLLVTTRHGLELVRALRLDGDQDKGDLTGPDTEPGAESDG
ncbi:conserved hypothetical protein [Microbacterium sp. C448]|uniref:hypothetical protein n=1 Tax=Microbacterium sp. C448 TaxID=1177594 RepID=UPI0003DE4093|nr:hypothetical protein [Microbacterium sp. C448]CDK01383.1 conserved hypothetical protein [Microbacterium sp. C448]